MKVKEQLPDPLKIRALNDAFRTTFVGGVVLLTASLAAECPDLRAEVLREVRAYDRFNPDNDPYGEHDFGSFTIAKEIFNWQIAYYDLGLEFGSPDPSDSTVTRRVLTIGPASDW